MKKLVTFIFAFSAMFAQAADFTKGNIVVALSGDGVTSTGATTNAPVALLEYNTTTENQALPLQTIPLNATPGSTMHTTGVYDECQLQNSEDGYWLVLLGYDCAPLTALATHRGGNKSIVKIGKAAVPSYISIPPIAAQPVRSIATVDGSAYWTWVYGGGITYFSDQSAVVPATSITSGVLTLAGSVQRNMRIFKNKLYAYVGNTLIYNNSDVLPTTVAEAASTILTLPAVQCGGFQFFDMDPSVDWNGTGYDVLYVADGSVGLKKMAWDGTAWVLKSTYSNNSTGSKGYVGMAARIEAGMPTFYVTQTSLNATSTNQLVKIVDCRTA